MVGSSDMQAKPHFINRSLTLKGLKREIEERSDVFIASKAAPDYTFQ